MLDDLNITATAIEQIEIEQRVQALYAAFLQTGVHDEDDRLALKRGTHAKYLSDGLGELPAGFCSLDASRTWICYWIVHSLALLRQPQPDAPSREAITAFIASCQHPGGGFGGGPYQLPHLATTYAAVCTLVTLGGAEALGVVNRGALLGYLLRMCVPPGRGGGMTMHEGGEVDVRGCYCALACCHLLGLDKVAVAEACDLVQYVRACQSYEGGIGGESWNEAHGGYTFCGFAALALAGRSGDIDAARLLRWGTRMQGWMEGGFMGRTCKLVDGCYSFWQAAAFPLLQNELLRDRASPVSLETSASSPGLGGVTLGEDAEQLRRSANRIAAELMNDAGTAEFVAGLQPLSPEAAAQRQLEALQSRLDTAVDDSLQCEQQYKEAVQGAAVDADELKHKALAALGVAAAVQEAVQRAEGHLDAAACAAPSLLQSYSAEAAGAAWAEQRPSGAALYHPAALQLWLLAACQAPRGGLRDKPGKGADYYHTCYCLSGLSSSQHSTGVVVGGRRNQLARADPLCNVVADRVEEARAFFAGQASR